MFICSGDHCDQDVDECARQPSVCQNGGTCINSNGDYMCVCVNGWSGHDCTVNEDDCAMMPCYSGGTCHDRVGYFFCECPKGKTGKNFPLHSHSLHSFAYVCTYCITQN